MPPISDLTRGRDLPADIAAAVRRERQLRRAAEAANAHDTLGDAAVEVMAALVAPLGTWDAAHLRLCDDACVTCASRWVFAAPDGATHFAALVRATEDPDAVAPEVNERFFGTGAIMWYDDVTAVQPPPRRHAALTEAGVHSAVGVPILIGDVVVARLELFSCSHQAEQPEECQSLLAIGSMLGRVVERERATAERSIHLARLAAVTETAPAAVVTIDSAGTITGWNTAATKMFGWDAAEMIGATPERMFPPQEARRYGTGIAALASGQLPASASLDDAVDITAVHRDGHLVHGEAFVGTWREDGKAHFSVFVRDRSTRLAEKAMAQRDAVLRSRRHAVELNDSVIQGLVIAGYLLDGEDVDQARTVLADTLATSRKMVANLLEAGAAPDQDATTELAQQLQRSRAAEPGR